MNEEQSEKFMVKVQVGRSCVVVRIPDPIRRNLMLNKKSILKVKQEEDGIMFRKSNKRKRKRRDNRYARVGGVGRGIGITIPQSISARYDLFDRNEGIIDGKILKVQQENGGVKIYAEPLF